VWLFLRTANLEKSSPAEIRSDSRRGLPLVLLHGNLAGPEMFQDLSSRLGERRLLMPDLREPAGVIPGTDDFSSEAEASRVLALLDSKGIRRFHILGQGRGGATAVFLMELAGKRAASLTLLSSSGTQENDLLGDHFLNHALYGLWLATVTCLYYGVPHFGYLDGPLRPEEAKNFFETDLRSVRSILEKTSVPVLILQGGRDLLASPKSALELRALIADCELVFFSGGHDILHKHGAEIASRINEFLSEIQKKRSARTELPAAKTSVSTEGLIVPFAGNLIVLLAVAIGTLVSEDLAAIAGGLLAGRGAIGFFPALTAAFAGIYLGDLLLYVAGKYTARLLRFLPFLSTHLRKTKFNPARLSQGPAAIFVSRFLPGSRLPLYLAAGGTGYPFRLFALYTFLAVALWSPLLVGLSWYAGAKVLRFFETYSAYALPLFLGLVLIIMLFERIIIQLLTRRGRRLLQGALIRKVRWEFWPIWFFYIPVTAYILYLGLKFRNFTLFTAANPGIPDGGGIIGESKSAILAKFGNARSVARGRLVEKNLSPGKKAEIVQNFLRKHGGKYPLVLKPDAGERGTNVLVASNEEEAQKYIREADFDFLVQEYIPGREFGIFYYRYPEEKTGRIFAITDKKFLSLQGDGRSTVEELILRDERAFMMAGVHFEQNSTSLSFIPGTGESFPLVKLGNHCRGAVFYDGHRLLTPALEKKVDELSRKFRGFYFGRYDVRSPSESALMRGNFLVIELNGITSEATSIYDPSSSVFRAWKTLFMQWKIAFEIGRQNSEKGFRPLGAMEFLRVVFQK